MTLTKEEKDKIKDGVEASVEYLEEVLNDRLNEIIVDLGINDEDALLYAREVFF